MELEEGPLDCQLLLRLLATTSQLNIVVTTLDFLGTEELVAIGEMGLHYRLNSQWFRVAIAKAFMVKYLNRVDRTVFFVFYEDLDFRKIEANTIHYLATQHAHTLAQAYSGYQQLLSAISTYTQYLSTQAEFGDLIEQLFLEPDLPMPKLKRESIGMFCETGFQEYLALRKFPPEEEALWMEQCLEELREQVAGQVGQLTEQGVYSDYGQADLNNKIRVVRFCGYKVNYINWQTYLIEGFKTHNLIVLLLALCSQVVHTYRQLLVSIPDPFMRFTEFALRSNVYRNIVLSIEEKMAFLFDAYSNFYSISFGPPPEYPPLNFWRPALSIWAQLMQHFHPDNQKAYNYVTSKLREANLNTFLIIKTQKLPSFFTELKREIELQTFSQKRKVELYLPNQNQLEMEAFFQNNQEMYETLAKDYLEYMVDISINEFNVHWCGHSYHAIESYPLFHPFLASIKHQAQEFYHFIKGITDRSVPKEIKLNIFREVVKEDLSFAGERLFKPVIVRQLSEMINNWVKQEVALLSEFAVFSEEGYLKHKLSMDFEEKDGLLTYFANKHSLSEDCPQDLSFFYNTQVEDYEPSFLKEKYEEENLEENLEEIERYISDEEEMVEEKHEGQQ